MKKLLAALLCLALFALPAAAEPEGAPEAPARIDPEARYDGFMAETDGSEQLLFAMLDAQNDEAEDIAAHGAVFITENQQLDDAGEPAFKVDMVLQDTPYGTAIISAMQHLETIYTLYFIDTWCVIYDGATATLSEGYTREDYVFYVESFHFPYGPLQALNGVRQDAAGYTCYFIQSDENRSFEFVAGENMRIVQLRVYERREDGALALASFVDYDTGAALDVPQPVLDAFGEVLEPVEDSAEKISEEDQAEEEPEA